MQIKGNFRGEKIVCGINAAISQNRSCLLHNSAKLAEKKTIFLKMRCFILFFMYLCG